jgi:O-antigen/teichoic acid export membrane protein
VADAPAEPNGRSLARARRLRAAVASSALSKVSSVAYQVLAVPLIFASVGSAGYSEFAVVLAAFGWLDPLFVGLGSAVTERISSDGSRPISAQTRGTFMTALSVSGALLGVFLLGGTLLLLSRPPGEPDHTALVLAGLTTGLVVGGGVFDSGLLGLQRSYVTNLLSFASSLVAVGATAAAAVIAPTVGAMVVATLGPVVLAKAVSGFVLHRVEPGLWGRVGDIAWRAAPRIAGRGLVFAAISFASFLSLDAGLLVVAGKLGTTQVPAVALVIRVLPLILSIVGMITVPLWPAIAEAAEDGDVRWIVRVASRSAAFVMAYAITAAVVVVIAGQKVLSLWTGDRISMSPDILVAAGVLIIMISFENVAQTVLFGLGRAGILAAVLVSRSILSLILVFLLAGVVGQQAALLGPIISGLLVSSWLLPLLVVRGVRAKARPHLASSADPP